LGIGLYKAGEEITPTERKEWNRSLRNAMAQAQKEADQIKSRTFSRWDKLYYCHRDDIVFLPDENLSAPSSGMMQMLMWK
jgi:hypothetical protein